MFQKRRFHFHLGFLRTYVFCKTRHTCRVVMLPFLLLLHSAAVENKYGKALPHPGDNLLQANWTNIIFPWVVIQGNYYLSPVCLSQGSRHFFFSGHVSTHPFRFCRHRDSLKTGRLLPSVWLFFVFLVLLRGKGHLKALVFT